MLGGAVSAFVKKLWQNFFGQLDIEKKDMNHYVILGCKYSQSALFYASWLITLEKRPSMYPRMLDDVATLHPAPGKSVGGANNHNTGLVRRGAKPVNYGALSSLVIVTAYR